MIGIQIGDYHTYTDFGLLLTEKKEAPPEAKINKVEVDGRNGSLDLTEIFGDVCYEDRKAEYKFVKFGGHDEMQNIADTLSNYLHGQKVKIIRDWDENYYFYGRVEIGNVGEIDQPLGELEIDLECEPYKYHISTTTVEVTIAAGEETTVTLPNDFMKAVPTITVEHEEDDESSTLFACGDSSLSVSDGTYEIESSDFILPSSGAEWTIENQSGTYSVTVTIKYQEGRL